jgi:hypothetical protein
MVFTFRLTNELKSERNLWWEHFSLHQAVDGPHLGSQLVNCEVTFIVLYLFPLVTKQRVYYGNSTHKTVSSIYVGPGTGRPSPKFVFWTPHRSPLVEIFQNFRKTSNVTILITRQVSVTSQHTRPRADHAPRVAGWLNTLSALPCKSRVLSRSKVRQTDRIITHSRAYWSLRVHGSNPQATCHAFPACLSLSEGSGFVAFFGISHKTVPILSTITLS